VVWFIVALGCALLTARFGVWQLSRAHAKLANEVLIAERGAMPALPAAELARDGAVGERQWQRHVDVTGEWDAAHTVFLMNRTMAARWWCSAAGSRATTPTR